MSNNQRVHYIGRVLDRKKQAPIRGAKVSINAENFSVVTYSDLEGIYRFTANSNIDRGNSAKIVVEAKGYANYNSQIKITASQKDLGDIKLGNTESSTEHFVPGSPAPRNSSPSSSSSSSANSSNTSKPGNFSSSSKSSNSTDSSVPSSDKTSKLGNSSSSSKSSNSADSSFPISDKTSKSENFSSSSKSSNAADKISKSGNSSDSPDLNNFIPLIIAGIISLLIMFALANSNSSLRNQRNPRTNIRNNPPSQNYRNSPSREDENNDNDDGLNNRYF